MHQPSFLLTSSQHIHLPIIIPIPQVTRLISQSGTKFIGNTGKAQEHKNQELYQITHKKMMAMRANFRPDPIKAPLSLKPFMVYE